MLRKTMMQLERSQRQAQHNVSHRQDTTLQAFRSSSLAHSYTLAVDGHQVKEVKEKADISLEEPEKC
eukprot:gene22820-28993_t